MEYLIFSMLNPNLLLLTWYSAVLKSTIYELKGAFKSLTSGFIFHQPSCCYVCVFESGVLVMLSVWLRDSAHLQQAHAVSAWVSSSEVTPTLLTDAGLSKGLLFCPPAQNSLNTALEWGFGDRSSARTSFSIKFRARWFNLIKRR